MKFFGDYHVHTRFCDGINTPEEIVLSAVEMGLNALGFSGHAYTEFDESYCMSRENTAEYVSRVRKLQQQYEERFNILLGIEQDYFGEKPEGDFDYTIGSCHYVKCGGVYLPVDESEELFLMCLQEHFSGSIRDLAECYYSQMQDVVSKTGCNIIGHFDLITKYNEGEKHFSQGGVYLDIAIAAIDSLCDEDVLFEINTGAMSRGYRQDPYPDERLLQRICHRGGSVMLSSDCHDKTYLCHGFEKAAYLAEKAGFRYLCVLTANGVEHIKI